MTNNAKKVVVIIAAAVVTSAVLGTGYLFTKADETGPVRIPTPTTMPTPTAVGGPQPNSNGAMARANIQGTAVYSTAGVRQLTGLAWQFQTQAGGIESTPAVVDDVVYFGTKAGYFYALDTVSGREKWRIRKNLFVKSPAIAEQVIYFGTADAFYAVDRDGNEKWRFPAEADSGVGPFRDPNVAGGITYVAGWDVFSALDTQTGHSLWRFAVAGILGEGAVVADGLVYFATNTFDGRDETFLYALDASTGREVWDFQVGGDGIIGSPTVIDGTVFVGTLEGDFLALDAKTGQQKWRHRFDFSVITSPAVAYGLVFVTVDGKLFALDAHTGQEKWSFKADEYSITGPIVADGAVYFVSAKIQAFLLGINSTSNLYAIDAQTGEELWRYSLPGGGYREPAIADGVIYLGGSDGIVYAVR